MQGLLRLMREHQLQIPGDLAVLLPTLGVLDGVAHQIDPDFRMMDARKPFARRYLPGTVRPGARLEEHRPVLTSLRPAGRAVPRPSRPGSAASRGGRVHGRGQADSTTRKWWTALRRSSICSPTRVIVGALIIGFAFLAGRQGLSVPELVVYRTVLFLAIASAIGLFVTVIRNERRKRRADKRVRR